MNQSESIMIGTMAASASEIYEAVLSLSRSIAGRTDLGLILHDPDTGVMQGHILNEPGNPEITSLRMPVEADPAGWVWLNQQPRQCCKFPNGTGVRREGVLPRKLRRPLRRVR
jgi:hypothetical protein